jgi:hypothetical protein
LSKKRNPGGITILDFKLYNRAIVTQTDWNWDKNRQKDKRNRTEDPKINPHNYSHLIFDKKPQNMPWRRDSLSTNDAEKTG